MKHVRPVTGAHILLDFSAGSLPMGAIGAASAIECRATVHAVEPVRTIEIVKDGQMAWSSPVWVGPTTV